MTPTKTKCCGINCSDAGFREFGGMCAWCFSRSTSAQQARIRTALAAAGPPVPVVNNHHAHTHHHPPLSKLAATVIALIAGAAGAAAFAALVAYAVPAARALLLPAGW